MQYPQILGLEGLLGSSGPLFSPPRLLSEGRKSNQKPGGLWSWPAGLRETRAWEGVQSPVTELVGPRPRPLPSPGARRNWAGPWGEEVSPRLLGPPPRAIRLGSEGVLEMEQVGQGADPVSLGAWGPQVWGDTLVSAQQPQGRPAPSLRCQPQLVRVSLGRAGSQRRKAPRGAAEDTEGAQPASREESVVGRWHRPGLRGRAPSMELTLEQGCPGRGLPAQGTAHAEASNRRAGGTPRTLRPARA